MVFLQGDAGIGKSRLVDHAADMARQDGATVLIMQCASLRTNESLWPAAEAISALGAAGELDGHAPLDELLRDLSPWTTTRPGRHRRSSASSGSLR